MTAPLPFEGGSPGPGRPRDPTIDGRIIETVIAVVGADGARAASVARIAEASGIGKPTIYLRWSGIREILLAAIGSLEEPVTVPEARSPDERLARAVDDDRRLLVDGSSASFLRCIAFWTPRDPALADALTTAILTPRQVRLQVVLEAARGNGRSPRPGHCADVARALFGAVVAEMLMGRTASARLSSEALVETFCAGILGPPVRR